MPHLAIVVALLAAAVPLVGLARTVGIPYPIVVVLGGLFLGFVPGLPHVTLDPDVVLLVFLPPLLYWEAVTAPTDDMRANARWIWPLAIGLVLATTAVVATVMHALAPALGWGAAFVLGAVVAPTDEIAAVQVGERLRVPRHVLAVIDGEALLNDAGSLVIYAAAVAAVVTGRFSLASTAFAFFAAAIGAVALGLAVGWLAVRIWRRFTAPELQAVISVLLPFVAYVPAQRLQLSGVLAVIVAGVYVNRWTPLVLSPATRLIGIGWWEVSVFLVNVLVFIVMGLQLHDVVARVLLHHGWVELLVDTVAINVAIVALRFAWVFGQGKIRFFNPPGHDESDPKHLTITALAGMRGAVSLAAALGVPATVLAGGAFPERDLIVFLTFAVILVTLVGGGLLLPAVIRALRLPPASEEREELRLAMHGVAEAGLRELEAARRAGEVDDDLERVLRARFEHQRDRYDEQDVAADDERARRLSALYRRLLHAQRKALLRMRARGEIDNTVLRRVQLSLDAQSLQAERFGEDVALDSIT